MRKKLLAAIRVLFSKDSSLDIRSIKYLPRWVVLIIDLSLVVLSLVLTYYTLYDMGIVPLDVLSNIQQVMLITSISLFSQLLFSTFSGLIRHSTHMDAFKIFLSCICTVTLLGVINFGYWIVTEERIFINSGIILFSFISFSLQFVFRLSVKQLYEYFKIAQNNEQIVNAVVVGIDEGAISIAAALDLEHPKRFDIKGFISKNEKKQLRILGKPINFTNGNIVEVVQKMNAQAIIFAGESYTSKEKYAIVEKCLEANIKVYNSPVIIDWSENKSVTKQLKTIQIEDLLERDPIVLKNAEKARQLYDKVVLVTGGAGSIGSEIVRQVATYNPKLLIVLDQAETPLYDLKNELITNHDPSGFEWVICDVANRKRLQTIFERYNIDLIYHAAAYKHVPLMEDNPSEAVITNIYGTKNVADLAVDYEVGHFVMISTDKAVNPSNVMGASKRAAEMYVQSRFFYEEKKNRKSKTKFITTRFGNVLGSNGSVVPVFKRQIDEGGPITITHPKIIRYFMTIPEACQLVLEAATFGRGGEIFIFDMGEPVKILDLAEKMIKLAGYTPHTDIEIKITGLRPGEKLYEELLTDSSKILLTHHPKIMISQDINHNFEQIEKSMGDIIKSALKYQDSNTVGLLKAMIPEFKSMNSTYEVLDTPSK